MKDFHRLWADLFDVKIELDPPSRVTKIDKVTFAHVSMSSDSASHPKRFSFFESFPNLRNRTRSLECSAKRFYASRTQRSQFFASLRNKFVLRLHLRGANVQRRRKMNSQNPLKVAAAASPAILVCQEKIANEILGQRGVPILPAASHRQCHSIYQKQPQE